MQEFWDTITGWLKGNFSDFALSKLYITCAIAGGTVLLGQTGLNLFGIGGDTDVDPDVDVDDLDGGDSLNFLSVRALAGFLTFFGLVGWVGTDAGWGQVGTVGAAFASGTSVMFLVAFLMRMFQRLASSGNVKPENAVGKTARVYLRVPAERSGKGKITVRVQDRSMEYEAVTRGPELPTGSECRIVEMITEGTFEVASLK